MNAPAHTPGDEVVVKGVTYVVERYRTPEVVRAEGRTHTADRMTANGLAAQVVLRRPRGTKLHMGWVREDGRWTTLVSV